MKIAVIYKSTYGTTKKYAEWIAEDLNADLLEHSKAGREMLLEYDHIVYGGGLYASGILGIDLVAKNACKRLTVFTVGLADPETTDYSKILDKNIPAELRAAVKVFHLRGGVDYSKLSVLHRGMMAWLKRSLDKKPDCELTKENKGFLETYGGRIDFTERGSIAPLVRYIKKYT